MAVNYMAEKTIKVDKAVHQQLEEMKINAGVETFNEFLRYELGIISKPEVEELAAYLHDDLKETVKQIVSVIRSIGEFEERVTEERGREVLEFVSVDSNKLIASIKFDEKSFQVQYRGQGGEMKDCGRGWYSSTSEKPKFGRIRDISDYTDSTDVVEQVQTKMTGAYQRWGNN